MTRDELVKEVSAVAGIRKRFVREVVDGLVEVITEQLVKGESVKIPSLGTFSRSNKPARKMFTPLMGEYVDLPERNYPRFKPSAVLKKACNTEE